MDMQASLLVLGVSRYNFEDEKTGRRIQGAKAVLASPISDESGDGNRAGWAIASMALSNEAFNTLRVSVPCSAVCELDMAVSGGKMQASVVRVIEMGATFEVEA